MDKAGWHRSKDLEIPSNMILEFLPPYSPELNPVEIFWKILRGKFFHNVFFSSLEAVEDKLEQALKFYGDNPDNILPAVQYNWIINAILNAT